MKKTKSNLLCRVCGAIMWCPLLLSTASCADTEKAEYVAAQVEAAQMQGRNAARRFVNREWRDTMELQGLLLEARAGRTQFMNDTFPEIAAAYDSTFVSTLKTVRPDIAVHLK